MCFTFKKSLFVLSHKSWGINSAIKARSHSASFVNATAI